MIVCECERCGARPVGRRELRIPGGNSDQQKKATAAKQLVGRCLWRYINRCGHAHGCAVHTMWQLGCDHDMHQHVFWMDESVPDAGDVDALVDTAM